MSGTSIPSILSHCNGNNGKAWSQQTSEINISCYTESQAYVTPQIYDKDDKKSLFQADVFVRFSNNEQIFNDGDDDDL